MEAPEEVRARATLEEMQVRISQGPYAALGVSESASAEDVRAAFLGLTKQFHPARFARMSPELHRLSNEVFIGIKTAHDALMRLLAGGNPSASGALPVMKAPTGQNPPLARPGAFARGTDRPSQPTIARTPTPNQPAVSRTTTPSGAPATKVPAGQTPRVQTEPVRTPTGQIPRVQTDPGRAPTGPQPRTGTEPMRTPTGQLPRVQTDPTRAPSPAPRNPTEPARGGTQPFRASTPPLGTPITRPTTPVGARPGTPPVARPTTPSGVRPTTPPPPGQYNPDTVRHAGAPTKEPPFDERAAHREALILLNDQSWTQARQVLHNLAARVPQSKNYRALLGYARGREAQAVGRVDDAALEYQRALQLDPDLSMAKAALAEVQRRR